MNTSLLDKLGGRKMAMCLLGLALCVGAVYLKGDVPEGFREMLKYILTAGIGGNVASDIVAAVQTKVEGTAEAAKIEAKESPASPTVKVDLSGIESSLSKVVDSNGQVLNVLQQHGQALQYLLSKFPN